MKQESLIDKVDRYYSEKIKKFGPTPQGVDWNGEGSQNLRFDQLLKLIEPINKKSTVLDFGCGYGALLDYLVKLNINLHYTGFDISKEMIKAAAQIHPKGAAFWTSEVGELSQYDYILASGIFNVKGSSSKEEWGEYIFETISQMNSLSSRGFAFNLLTKYSDVDKMKEHLFYADPMLLFDYCKTKYSKSVALLHDYPLYEFTIIVRKNIL